MTNDHEDSGQWRDRVETRLGTLEATVKEEARLRAAMDKDLSGVRVEKNVLQAIQVTQSDHTRRLTALDEKVTALDEKVTTLDEKVDLVHAGVDTIVDLLGGHPGSAARLQLDCDEGCHPSGTLTERSVTGDYPYYEADTESSVWAATGYRQFGDNLVRLVTTQGVRAGPTKSSRKRPRGCPGPLRAGPRR